MSPSPVHHAELVLSSRFTNIEVAERALLDLCVRVGHDGDQRYWMVTALREALANAIRHGSRERAELSVEVGIRLSRRHAEIRVRDHGPGFDPGSVPDPTSAERLLRPTGRGIFYMRQFMDHVEFEPVPGGVPRRGVRQATAERFEAAEDGRIGLGARPRGGAARNGPGLQGPTDRSGRGHERLLPCQSGPPGGMFWPSTHPVERIASTAFKSL